jgi:DUF1680 family protein
MQSIEFSDIKITGGYWKTRHDINSEVTLKSVYERFRETHRFDALKCGWKDGDPDMPNIFWDSDVAKWLEGAAYILNSKDDESIAEIIENAIDCIIENSDENGYFNSHYLVTEQGERFCHRDCHELYCAGHLFEAAVSEISLFRALALKELGKEDEVRAVLDEMLASAQNLIDNKDMRTYYGVGSPSPIPLSLILKSRICLPVTP